MRGVKQLRQKGNPAADLKSNSLNLHRFPEATGINHCIANQMRQEQLEQRKAAEFVIQFPEARVGCVLRFAALRSAAMEGILRRTY